MYSLVLMLVESCMVVSTVSCVLGNITIKVKAEYDKLKICSICSIFRGWIGLGAMIMEEDVVGIGVNESRGWLTLERERSQRRKQIRTMTVITVQMNTIISTESNAVVGIKVMMALPSAVMKVWI